MCCTRKVHNNPNWGQEACQTISIVCWRSLLLLQVLVAASARKKQISNSHSRKNRSVLVRTPAKPEEVEVIEVKGFSSSLIKSLNDKRFADTVVESISADDLGALPDVSMADALTRLPGISAVRTGGQASEINIRGMAGGFVFSTLNGREQVSTSGQRNIEFDQYPSELISSASVYKSPKASLIEGGGRYSRTENRQSAQSQRNS